MWGPLLYEYPPPSDCLHPTCTVVIIDILLRTRAPMRIIARVPTGQGKLEKVREFEWSGKVRENAKVTGKSGKFWGKNFIFFVQLL